MPEKVRTTRRLLMLAGLCLLALTGCAEHLTGPSPELSGTPGADAEEDRLVQPPFICNEQIENKHVEIRGEKFSPMVVKSLEDPTVDPPTVRLKRSEELDVRSSNGRTEVTFGADKFETERLRWIEQERLRIVVDESLDLQPGLYDVTLTNPSGDSDSVKRAFAVLPRPVVTGVDPSLACAGSGEQQLTVSGGPFLKSPDGEVSPVGVGDHTFEGGNVAAGDCQAFDSGPLMGWSICKKVTATVSIDAFEPGRKAVSAQNLAPAGCESLPEEDDVQFRVLRRPVVDAVTPSPVCTKQHTYTATVTGKNFVFDTRKGLEPTVTVAGNEVDVTRPTSPADAEACSATDIDGVFACNELDVDLSPEGLLHEDGAITANEVVVDNPPGSKECKADDPGTIQNAPPPVVSRATATGTCGDGPTNMLIEGAFHFEMGDRSPNIEVTSPSGTTKTYEDPELTGMCSQLDNASASTRYCDSTKLTLGKHPDAEGGEYTIAYNNPESVECSRENSLQVDYTVPEKPTIDGIAEDAICGLGDAITVDGENFKDGAMVTFGNTQAASVDVADDGTSLTATFDGEIDPGQNPTLTIENPDDCTATTMVPDSLSIVEGPLAVFLDPPVHYNDIQLRGTLYASGGTDKREISKVQIRDDDGNVRELSFENPTQNDGEVSPLLPDEDPTNAGNPLPAGEYDVRLTEQVTGTACGAWVDNLLKVTADENLTLEDVEPTFGGTQSATSIRLTASDTVSGNETQFQETPRVYISPGSGTSGSLATELSGVAFNSATEITGIVPSGLSPGSYTLIVVNPDETVGVLADGFTVTSDPPPTIANVTPGTWDTPANPTVTVTGDHFRVSAGQSNPDPIGITCENGQAPASISIQSSSKTSITLSVDTSNMNKGDACVLEVTNPDGSTASYSPIATVSPSYNFVQFEDGPPWNTARRWPAMSSGVPSTQQRFLYTLGGDDGSTGGVHQSGEFAQIDQYGNVQDWRSLPNDLPGNGRTLARAQRIRDFVYLVGGHDGNSTTAAIHRANVLDPQHSPTVDTLDFEFAGSGGSGLSPGVYFYRIAAVHTSASSHNPGGESLTSNVQPVYIPDLGNRFSVQVDISWTSSLANVDQFRVYRSPTPNVTVGDEQLLATVGANTTSFTDDGTGSFDASETPLPVGALGQWHKAGSLKTARRKHGLRGLVNPTNPSEAYIYAVGGEDTSGTPLDTVERITITDSKPDTPRSQSLSGVTTMTETMSSTRTELEALVATPANASNLTAGTAHLYAIGGNQTGGMGNPKGSDIVDAWPINADGSLGNLRSGASPGKSRAGHVGTIANNFALLFGGHNASPDNSGDNSNELGTGGQVTGWNSLSSVGMEPRYQFGRVSLAGFFYVGGGVTDNTGTVSDSVEYTVVGTTAQ